MAKHIKEIWKPVVNYEGLYEVSNLGRVRRRGRVLKQHVGEANRRSVCLSRNAVVVRRKTHQLVLEAFVGPRAPGMECCHADGDASNNTLSNLRWDTKAANMADAKRHGTAVRGSKHGAAILSELDIPVIRRRLRQGEPQKRVAADYGVTSATISAIKRGKLWSHVG